MNLFCIPPQTMTCSVKAPVPSSIAGTAKATIDFKVENTQLALLSNDATTGHKLQGQTKESLAISIWSKRRNWNCVALSRVKSRAGFFLVMALPHNSDFSVHAELKIMLQELAIHKPTAVGWETQELRDEREAAQRRGASSS